MGCTHLKKCEVRPEAERGGRLLDGAMQRDDMVLHLCRVRVARGREPTGTNLPSQQPTNQNTNDQTTLTTASASSTSTLSEIYHSGGGADRKPHSLSESSRELRGPGTLRMQVVQRT